MRGIPLVLVISLLCANLSYGLSLKMRGKISMILILSLIGAVDLHLHHRDEVALERSCKTLNLGELRSIRRYRHGLDLIEIRIYERGAVTVRDGMIWRVEDRLYLHKAYERPEPVQGGCRWRFPRTSIKTADTGARPPDG